jgi:hypothetical protein
MLNFKRPCEVPSRRLANTTSSRPARSCSGPFDGGDDALGEAAGEGDREISGAGRDRPADGERGPPSHHKIIPPADIEERQRPLTTKAMMAVITTGKTNLALPSCVSRSLYIEVVGNNQNCLASSTACLFPASIMSTARPSQVCSTVRVTTLRTPMNRSQNST